MFFENRVQHQNEHYIYTEKTRLIKKKIVPLEAISPFASPPHLYRVLTLRAILKHIIYYILLKTSTHTAEFDACVAVTFLTFRLAKSIFY